MGPKLEIGASFNSKGLKSGIASATGSVKSFGQTIQTAMGFGLYQVVSRVMGLFSDMAGGAVKIAARFEMINLQFESLIGNTAKAKKLMAELREFSVKTPFTPEDVFKAGKILLTQFPAREIRNELEMIGNVAAVTGKDLNELALIYAKVAERGKVNARVLNQFANAGIPISRFLAEVKGSTAIRELSEQGQISFNDMREALQNMAAEWNGLEKASQTVEGRWSTLVGVMKDFLASIGTELRGVTLDAINAMIDLLSDAGTSIKTLTALVNGLAFAWDQAAIAVLGFTDIIAKSWDFIPFLGDTPNPFNRDESAMIKKIWEVEEKMKNFERGLGYSLAGGKFRAELVGGPDIASPADRAAAMMASAGASGAFSGDAASGLFRSMSASDDIPKQQLFETRRQTEILEDIREATFGQQIASRLGMQVGGFRNGAGR